MQIQGPTRGAVLMSLLACTAALAQSPDADFRVSDIRIEGLERVSEGTVYNYLPVNIGDSLSVARLREAIRALYATGFFRDVQLRRDGSTLIVVVLERPSIESFEITGNKDIKTEDLQKVLRSAGLTVGKTFDASVLEALTQSLTDQYFSRGKYGVRIDTSVEEQSGNRVRLEIDVKEGKRARIRQINLVGNEDFSDEQILDDFELKTPALLSFYKQDDRYSRESLQGDLERLRSFYMDQGYANFRVESTQVAIAPEKDDIFITVNVDEGEVYKISEVKLTGTFVVPEPELRRFLLVAPGQTFSLKLITSTQELLQNRLGADGYPFTKVEAIPVPDDKTHTIGLTFIVEPGNRAYVRNITFGGATGIRDEVLRREMRQLEGSWMSNVALERSKQRIQRLPYVKDVDFETVPVPGSPDLVDVNFEVEEGQSATLGGSIGYSEYYKTTLSGNLADANFLGTGQRLSLDISHGAFNEVFGISHTQPYTTMDGVSRTIDVMYRDLEQLNSRSSQFSTKTWLTGVSYGYPISERQVVRFGGSWQHVELATSNFSSQQLQDWISSNGDPIGGNFGSFDIIGSRYRVFELTAGWNFDSRDRVLFPTKGASHRLSFSATVPGSEVEWFTAEYDYEQYLRIPLPLANRIPLRFHTRLGFGTALGDTTALPPNKRFFLGGSDSVRGFDVATLGPRDSLGNPYGGDLSLSGQFEAILPIPERFRASARATVFLDFGQNYDLGDTRFTDKGGFPADYSFDFGQMRASVGIGVEWLAPLGLFRFSYAFPLRYRNSTELDYGDDIEGFQFEIGKTF
jgi:outer membrane protein insertion porin family